MQPLNQQNTNHQTQKKQQHKINRDKLYLRLSLLLRHLAWNGEPILKGKYKGEVN